MRKFAFFSLVSLLLVCFLTLSVSAGNIYGDVNSDSVVDISDSVRLAQYLAKWSVSFSQNELDASDVFPDGVTDIKDAVMLSQYLAGQTVVLGHKSITEITEEEFLKMKNLVIYPEFPDAVNRIYDYDVSVTMDGKTAKIPVYNHVVESNVTRRPGADIYRRFSQFAFSGGTVRVDIKVKTDFGSYTVFPSAKQFRSEFNDGVISVFLDEPDYFGIELDDDQNTILSVFADYPEYTPSMPKKGDENVIYVDSWYETSNGRLVIDKAGTTVYIAPGAVLNARLLIKASNCRVIGHGAIIDPFEDIYNYDIRVGGTEYAGWHLVDVAAGTSNCLFDGPVMLDARTYNFFVQGKGHTVRNFKELSAMMTTDGTNVRGNVSYEHCWYYVGDNGLTTGLPDGVTAKDITIGTTCAALFPQADVDHLHYEDINVFRADNGIINNYYNNNSKEKTFTDIVIKRLTAVDMPSGLTRFFLGRNLGTLPKIFTFEDISIPKLSQTVRYENGNNYLFTGNYTLNIKNMSIAGNVIKSAGNLPISNPQGMVCTENVTYDPSFTGVLRNMKMVNYTAKDKIFVGKLQVFTSLPVKHEGGKVLLPTEEICSLLRFPKISGDEYITADALKDANAVSGVSISENEIRLTPSYNGENLLLADKGEISRFAEEICYQVDLYVTKEGESTVYNLATNKSGTVKTGISRQITEEVRMYGAGTYRVAFNAKASSDGKLRMNFIEGSNTKENQFSVGTSWKGYKFDISVTDAMMESPNCAICIVGAGTVLDEFSLKNITLTKIN